jgi:acetyl esterase/lipase
VLEGTAKPAFDDAIISALSASSNSTIVRVNYRAGQLAPFPTAIHDVLAGYDWLANYLADEDETDGRSTERRIGVCGQLLGGGLASSLALTECRLGQPSIVAAAVNNPITDWVLPDREQLEAELSDSDSEIQEEVGDRESDIALGRKKKRSKTKTPAESSWQQFQHSDILSASAFKKARNDIFTSENAYFDNFASPIHWFRTPGIEVAENLKNLSIDDEDPPIPQLLRKYRLNFPPTGSGLELPHVRMSTGEESILKTSNEEFLSRLNMAEVTTYLRARKIKYAKYSSLVQDDKEEVDFICDIADKKFPINTLPGVGIWGLGREEIWRPDIEGAGRWLRNLMLPP